MTNAEIYHQRMSEAQARIDADRAAGRGATRLDLYRLDLNRGLLMALASRPELPR